MTCDITSAQKIAKVRFPRAVSSLTIPASTTIADQALLAYTVWRKPYRLGSLIISNVVLRFRWSVATRLCTLVSNTRLGL
jgi:hypothetical protein